MSNESVPTMEAISRRCGSNRLMDICTAALPEEVNALNVEINRAPMVPDYVGYYRQQQSVGEWLRGVWASLNKT
jgi:hypothetical protein